MLGKIEVFGKFILLATQVGCKRIYGDIAIFIHSVITPFTQCSSYLFHPFLGEEVQICLSFCHSILQISINRIVFLFLHFFLHILSRRNIIAQRDETMNKEHEDEQHQRSYQQQQGIEENGYRQKGCCYTYHHKTGSRISNVWQKIASRLLQQFFLTLQHLGIAGIVEVCHTYHKERKHHI